MLWCPGWAQSDRVHLLRSAEQQWRFTWRPWRSSLLIAICLPLMSVPQYTRPKPPSPMMQAADQPWLAASSSLYVKYLQLSGCTWARAVLYG